MILGILGLLSANGGMNVGLWELSSLDGPRLPWYRHQKIVALIPERKKSEESGWCSTLRGWVYFVFNQTNIGSALEMWQSIWAFWRNLGNWNYSDFVQEVCFSDPSLVYKCWCGKYGSNMIFFKTDLHSDLWLTHLTDGPSTWMCICQHDKTKRSC